VELLIVIALLSVLMSITGQILVQVQGATRKGTVVEGDGVGPQRKYNIAEQIPGFFMEQLQHGEEPVAFGNQGTDINFPEFEESIVQGMAWSLELPPEILRLSFSSNYSASQAAINEFKIVINKLWSNWGENFCTRIEVEWLISEVLNGKIEADGLLEAWRNPEQYDIFGAWTLVEWYGSVKISTDMLKTARGSKVLVDEGWSTNSRESRLNSGTKFTRNIKKLKRENAQKVEAMRPILELQREFGAESVNSEIKAIEKNENILTLVEETINDKLEDNISGNS